MIPAIKSDGAGVRATLILLLLFAAILTTSCAKFNPAYGGGGDSGKGDGAINLFGPDSDDNTTGETGSDGYNGDFIVPPGDGGFGSVEDSTTTFDPGGGRRQ